MKKQDIFTIGVVGIPLARAARSAVIVVRLKAAAIPGADTKMAVSAVVANAEIALRQRLKHTIGEVGSIVEQLLDTYLISTPISATTAPPKNTSREARKCIPGIHLEKDENEQSE